MKLFTLILALGLVALMLFPAEWRLALALGWGPAILAEALLAQRRLAVVGKEVRNHQFLSILVFGFLGRLTLIFLGAVLGAKTGLYPEGPFMAACLAAILVGEAVSLPQLARASRQRRSTPESSLDNPPPRTDT